MDMATANFVDKTVWTGDNLDILRGMNSECVDLIYLDPPFNSNRDYAAPVGSAAAGAAFKDTWTLSDLDVAWMRLIADEQPAVAHTLKAAGFSHGKGMQSYLTMMAVRLLEMRRVLKPTGSLYLHCDPTASHYLKSLLDAVFGASHFLNDITWQRHTARSDGRHWGNITDSILFYGKSDGYKWRNTYQQRKSAAVQETRGDLTGAGTRTGASGEPWKGYNPTDYGRHWAVPSTSALAQWIEENRIAGYMDIEHPHDRLDALDAVGMVAWADTGRPSIIRPASASSGAKVNTLWTDIRVNGSERTGYPTQKPITLLERIVAASSNPGDMVLDPFCGCATACVAAEALGRKWVGIDISPKAVELVNMRLQQAMGSLFHHGYVTARTDIPRRTDIDAPKNYRQNKHVLFGQQEGVCNGCRMDFPYKIFEVDHVIPQSRGGTDHIENLQLLCPSCNRIKGNRPQEYLMAQIKEMAYA